MAALTRAKKLPRLDKMLGKPAKPQRRQSWEEQLEIMRSWGAALSRRQ